MKYAVIGAAFGDEGKGVVTNYLCNRPDYGTNEVWRFSGGHQAGHTVVHDGVRHVFSNFGAGTLRGINTVWSKFCTIDPLAICREYKSLVEKGAKPYMLINPKCPVTTHYDKLKNMYNNATIKHGSCGVGFGMTLQREEAFYSLLAEDLLYPWAMHRKLDAIREYYGFDLKDYDLFEEEFLASVHEMQHLDGVSIVDTRWAASDIVYEGSQGLLLDQHYGFFPNVTRSNTGSTNIKELTRDKVNYHVVTRAYQTRHGNGPMTNEELGTDHILDDPLETNITHKYQGKFRKSMLDADLLKYAISKDPEISKGYTLCITCLEHCKDYRYTTGKGEVHSFNSKFEFSQSLARYLGCAKYLMFENHKQVGT